MKVLPIFAFLVIFLLLVSGCSAPSPAITPPSTAPIPSQSLLLTPTSTISNSAQTVTQPPTLESSTGKMMTVSFIDVGQGDSELIQSPSGNVMLIDAGPTNAGSKVVNYLRGQGINTIDIVVATHPHEDHIGGMTAVLNSFTVGQFIDSGYPHTTSTYENMLNIIDQKNIPFRTVKNGDTVTIDPSVSIQVLNPQSTFSTDINQNSVVLKMTYGKLIYLFTGDAGGMTTHADILKVPHHGSETGAGTLTQIAPSVSVIEVGAGNSYGHPTQLALSRLASVGSQIYRTDLNGNVVITSDGITYSVSADNSKTASISTISPAPVSTTTITKNPTAPATVITPTAYCTVNYETGTCPTGKCWVRDYCRNDGTHVNGYCRKC